MGEAAKPSYYLIPYSPPPSPPPPSLPPALAKPWPPLPRPFLVHLEAYLVRRDGVDKVLKICRYAAKVALASCPDGTLALRLDAFQTSVGLTRKALRIGKFIQNLNLFRAFAAAQPSRFDLLLAFLSFFGEGLYFFLDQFIWPSRAGLLPSEIAPPLQKLSSWAELIGYIGNIPLNSRDVKKMHALIDLKSNKEEKEEEEEVEEIEKLREKLYLKQLWIVQDLADGLMALGEVRNGKGFLTSPLLLASAGFVSALISTRRNWAFSRG